MKTLANTRPTDEQIFFIQLAGLSLEPHVVKINVPLLGVPHTWLLLNGMHAAQLMAHHPPPPPTIKADLQVGGIMLREINLTKSPHGG